MLENIIILLSIGITLIALCYIIINQMLMLNQVNKRMFVLAEIMLAQVGIDKDHTVFTDNEESEEPLPPTPYDPHGVD